MVATIATAASADYYIHSQASHRPVEEYYLSGEEPDGVWWNPAGLFGDGRAGMGDGKTVDSADFHRLYNGFHPVTGEKLTRNAGSAKRCPGYDLILNADKTVSALWAVAPPELRAKIEEAHDDAVRVALEDIVLRHCAYTRIRDREGTIKPVPADLAAALFRHGAARSNDPHLHTHCVILNAAHAHHDGKWRALHGHPLFSWQKAAGAVYRAELAWLLRARLGIAMEVHGKDGQYTRIGDTPEALVAEWSKRDSEINETAAKFGVSLEGNGAFHAAVQRLTRAPKQHGLDPEERHRIWRQDAGGIVPEIDAFIESSIGTAGDITGEERVQVARRLDELPESMTEMEAVFHYDDLVRRTADAAGGMLSRKEREDAFRNVLESEKIVRLDRPKPSPDAAASLIHTRAYTSAHNLDTERRIRDTARALKESGGFAITSSEVAGKLEELRSGGYLLSDEQCAAIRAATAGGRVAIVEGAAGSGKTTTLRPVADLYRERGYSVIATAVAWRAALELGSDLDADAMCVDKLLAMAARGRAPVDGRTVVFVDEAGMLSSAHADRILDLARQRGAKLVLAGDTEQQQPVTAGPGLRLVRDVVGSVRVDAMRRQLADAEDALVGLYGKTREEARLQGGGDDGRRNGRGSGCLRGAARRRVGQGQAVADRGVGGVPGRRRGGGHRGPCRARAVPSRAQPPPHPRPAGRRLGRTPEAPSRRILRGDRGDQRRDPGALLPDARARAGRRGRNPGHGTGVPGARSQGQTGAAGDRAGGPSADRRAALGEAAVQRHRAHRARCGGTPAAGPGRRAPGCGSGGAPTVGGSSSSTTTRSSTGTARCVSITATR